MANNLIPFLEAKPFEMERALRLFWNKVEKSDGDGCWTWKRRERLKFKKSQYGLFCYRSICGKTFFMDAHRFSLSIHDKGEKDLCVCHSCDNPPCVRPDHLWWGTHAENMMDKAAKGRSQKTPRFLEITDDVVDGSSLAYDEAFSKVGRIGAMKAALFYGLNRVIRHGSVERAFEIENKRLIKEVRKWQAKALQVESLKSNDQESRPVL